MIRTSSGNAAAAISNFSAFEEGLAGLATRSTIEPGLSPRSGSACDRISYAGTGGERAGVLQAALTTLDSKRYQGRVQAACHSSERADYSLARGDSFTAGSFRTAAAGELDIAASSFRKFSQCVPYRPTNGNLSTPGLRGLVRRFLPRGNGQQAHTWERHIGKSEHALRKRLATNARMQAAGTFKANEDAYLARDVILTADQNQVHIHNWMQNPRDRGALMLTAPLLPPIRSLLCGRNGTLLTPTSICARLVKVEPPGEFEINSIYPTPAPYEPRPARPTLEGPGETGDPVRLADLARPNFAVRLGPIGPA